MGETRQTEDESISAVDAAPASGTLLFAQVMGFNPPDQGAILEILEIQNADFTLP